MEKNFASTIFFFLIIYLKRRVCFGPVCECWLNWSRGAEVGEKRERGNKYKTIELYTRIHPSIPKRSDPYSLYYFLTTTPLHCVTLRYTALLSAKIIKPTSSKLFYTNDFIERILQDPKDPEGRCANKTYPPPDRRPKRQVHKQKMNTEQKRNPEPCNDRQRPNTASVNLYKDLRNYGLLSSHLGKSPPFSPPGAEAHLASTGFVSRSLSHLRKSTLATKGFLCTMNRERESFTTELCAMSLYCMTRASRLLQQDRHGDERQIVTVHQRLLL